MANVEDKLAAGSQSFAKVLYFAAAQEVAGLAEERFVFSKPEMRVADFRAWLFAQHPDLEARATRLRFAVNQRFVEDAYILRPGDEIAVIPPVGGG
jgi:molybdopterin converting factor subunit 1